MSTNHERDADIDRLLRTVLRPGAGPQAGECPEAAVLAAYVEGGLSKDEQSALDAHVVQCGRCQEALAIIGRDAPTPAAEPDRTGWYTWVTKPRLRWLVPITAVATVAVFFFATRPLIAPGDSPAPGDVTQLARATPEAEREPAPAAAPETPAVLPMDAAKDAGANEIRDRVAAAPDRQSGRAQRPGTEVTVPARMAEAAPAPPVVQVGQATLESKEALERTRNVAARADVDEKRARAAAEPVPAAPPAPAPAPAEFAAKSEAAPRAAAGASRPSAVSLQKGTVPGSMDAGAWLVVAAPDGITRWRLAAAGRISRSIDGGMTWRELASGTSSDLLAGSAPSPTQCWVVGAGGTVLLSQDGERWERRPFPLTADLIAVRAASSRAASVVARDGRRFETLDGGATWSPR